MYYKYKPLLRFLYTIINKHWKVSKLNHAEGYKNRQMYTVNFGTCISVTWPFVSVVPKRKPTVFPIVYCDRVFEFHQGHGCFSVVCLCCQVVFSATSWSLVQMGPTDWWVLCMITKPRGRGVHSPRWAVKPEKIIIIIIPYSIFLN
jgi:hypothetical protein